MKKTSSFSYTPKQKLLLYTCHLKNILNKSFTVRQIDVISCLIHNRNYNRTAVLLSIGYETVKTHVADIKNKISVNSTEQILDFIDKTGKRKYFVQYYVAILIESLFLDSIKKIKPITTDKIYHYTNFDYSYIKDKNFLSLLYYLTSVNINFSFNKSVDATVVVYDNLFTTSTIPHEKAICHLIFDSNINIQKISGRYINFTIGDNYYTSILRLIGILIEKENEINKIIKIFENEKQQVIHSFAMDIDPLLPKLKKPVAFKNIIFAGTVICIFLLSVIYLLSIHNNGVGDYSSALDCSTNTSNINYLSSERNLKMIYSFFKEERQQDFVGRTKELDTIEKLFTNNKIVALIGLPGIGKSSIALEYGHKFSKDNKITRWFDSDSPEKLIHELFNFAAELGIDTKQYNRETVIKIIMNMISQHNNNVLFIFDNVENYSDIKPFIANIPKNVNIIITSRNSNLFEDLTSNATLFVEQFTLEESKLYLSKKLTKYIENNQLTDSDIVAIISKTRNIPYNLKQACGYLKKNKLENIENFIKYYNEGLIVEMFLEQIKSEPNLWKILQCIAFLDPDFISTEILRKILKVDKHLLSKYIDTLEHISLASFINERGVPGIKVHRLAQEQIKDYIRTNSHIQSEQEILEFLLKFFDKEISNIYHDQNDYEWDKEKTSAVPCVKTLLDNSSNIIKIERSSLEEKIAQYYYHVLFEFEKAAMHYEKSLELHKQIQGLKSTKALQLSRALAGVYHDMGKISKALIYSKLGMDICKKIYGNKPNLDLANFINAMGVMYYESGDIKTSFEHFEKAKLMGEQVLKNSVHPDMLRYYNNSAKAKYTLGKIKSGLEDNKKAINIANELYKSKDHRNTIVCLANLSFAYFKLGYSDKALEYATKALTMSKRKFAQKPHRFFAISLNAVGLAYHLAGNLEKSHQMLLQAERMYSDLFNKQNHNWWLGALLNNLGSVNRDKGDIKKAIVYHKKAYDIYESLFPNQQRIEKALVLSNIGNDYIIIKKYQEAEKYLISAEEIYSYVLRQTENSNPDYANNIHRIGVLWHQRLKNPSLSISMLHIEKAFRMRINYFENKNHPHIMESLIELASLYLSVGDVNKSILYKKQAYLICKNFYGEEHIKTKKNLLTLTKNVSNITSESDVILLDQRGKFTELTFKVKKCLQKPVLNKIQNLSRDGIWQSSNQKKGIDYYIDETYLVQALGDFFNDKSLLIAKKLSFEAINIGITLSADFKKNTFSSLRFAQVYPEIVKDMIQSNPEYFINKHLLNIHVESKGLKGTVKLMELECKKANILKLRQQEALV